MAAYSGGGVTGGDFQAGLVTGIRQLAMPESSTFSLVLRNDGTIQGWGNNSYGQPGDGTLATPAVGDGVVLGAQRQWLLGRLPGSPRVGGGTVVAFDPIPRPVGGMPRVAYVSAGGGHSLALARDGTLWGWGLLPDNHSSAVPVELVAR